MKKSIIFISIAVTFFIQFSSCGKSKDNPVDQYIEILDKATKEAEMIKGVDAINRMQAVVTPTEAQELIRSSCDYPLTEEDKKKLKKSTDKLITVAFEKIIKFGNLNEVEKLKMEKEQEMAIKASNLFIDNAQTLGEISGVR